jgi:hypothetical protein
VVGLALFSCYGVVILELVLIGTGLLTLLASDTDGGVIQQGLAH